MDIAMIHLPVQRDFSPVSFCWWSCLSCCVGEGNMIVAHHHSIYSTKDFRDDDGSLLSLLATSSGAGIPDEDEE